MDKADRKELVRPAPAGFKPESSRRKLRLKLIARDRTIRVGQSFWYRLEIQNVGREPVKFWENRSFLKDGRRYTGVKDWDFFVETPDGKRRRMVIGTVEPFFTRRARPPIGVEGSEKMTDEEVQDFIRLDGARREAEKDLNVILAPGEVLVSRPWRWVGTAEHQDRIERGEKELWPRPEGSFREFWTSYKFKAPGRYRIQVVLSDLPGPPPSEELLRRLEKRGYKREKALADHREAALEHLGRVESNYVEIEVSP